MKDHIASRLLHIIESAFKPNTYERQSSSQHIADCYFNDEWTNQELATYCGFVFQRWNRRPQHSARSEVLCLCSIASSRARPLCLCAGPASRQALPFGECRVFVMRCRLSSRFPPMSDSPPLRAIYIIWMYIRFTICMYMSSELQGMATLALRRTGIPASAPFFHPKGAWYNVMC